MFFSGSWTRFWSRRLRLSFQFFEKSEVTAFGYKNRNVREETLYLLQKAICGKR